MSTAELLGLLGVISLGVIALAAVYFLRSAVGAMREVEKTARELREKGLPLIEDMHTLTVDTHEELRRVDEVMSAARSLSGTAEAAGKIAYLTVANPVVKGAAIASGVKGATRALVKGE